jgi:hypothetical protein
MSTSDKDEICAAGDRGYRSLWIAVVLQAKTDIENEPLDSIHFAKAVAFFIGSGAWAENRVAVGDYLDLHRDDLERLGRRCINARRIAEGLEPLLPRQPWPTVARAKPAEVQRFQPKARSQPARPPQFSPSLANALMPQDVHASPQYLAS